MLITRLHRIIIIICTLVTLVGAALLPITSDVILKSQSSYAWEPNRIYYFMIHFGMIFLFFFLNALSSKKPVYGIVAFLSLLTLMFDMFLFSNPHNITTAGIFLSASYCIINYTKIHKKITIPICSTLGILFLIGALVSNPEEIPIIHLIEIFIEVWFSILIIYQEILFYFRA